MNACRKWNINQPWQRPCKVMAEVMKDISWITCWAISSIDFEFVYDWWNFIPINRIKCYWIRSRAMEVFKKVAIASKFAFIKNWVCNSIKVVIKTIWYFRRISNELIILSVRHVGLSYDLDLTLTICLIPFQMFVILLLFFSN